MKDYKKIEETEIRISQIETQLREMYNKNEIESVMFFVRFNDSLRQTVIGRGKEIVEMLVTAMKEENTMELISVAKEIRISKDNESVINN